MIATASTSEFPHTPALAGTRTQRKGYISWHAIRDFLVLCVTLAGVNALLAGDQPGWVQLNPTPWLLPAALVGIRHGFASGLLGGLLTSGGIALLVSQHESSPVADTLHEYAYFFLTLAVTGALAGEAGTLLGARVARLERGHAFLTEENLRLRDQLQMVDETRHQLQRQLALHNAPMCAADEEMARLLTLPREEFAGELLTTLHRLTGVTSAGIYTVWGNSMTLEAMIHPTPPLAATLDLAAAPLAHRALQARALASVPDATALTEAQPFLAALPWRDPLGRTCVVLIQDMPLESFTLQNLARLEVLLSWAATLSSLRQSFVAGASPLRPVSNEDFTALLAGAIDAWRVHRVPSVVLRFHTGRAWSPTLLRHLPATAVTTQARHDGALVVLLPFSGEAEAIAARHALRGAAPGVRDLHFVIAGEIAAETLWDQLQRS